MIGHRVRLLQSLEIGIPAGAEGVIVDEFYGDDMRYSVKFDGRKSALMFWEQELDQRSPEYKLEVLPKEPP